MDCDRCGHVNPDTNRFCGACGQTLAPIPEFVAVHEKQSPPPSIAISGPSILGLGETEEQSFGGDSLHYLFDNDEPHRSGHGVTVLLVILLLGGAALLGWHRWNKVLIAQAKFPLAMVAHPPGFAFDHTSEAAKQADDPEPADELLAGRAGTDQMALQHIWEEMVSDDLKRQADKRAMVGHPEAKGDSDEEGDDKQLTPTEMTLLGEQYLFARGAKRDCQKAMSNFQSAADDENSRAMMRLGEMFASGTCVERNRLTAYDWYRKAKNADPNNQNLDARMDQLWKHMTPSERRTFLK